MVGLHFLIEEVVISVFEQVFLFLGWRAPVGFVLVVGRETLPELEAALRVRVVYGVYALFGLGDLAEDILVVSVTKGRKTADVQLVGDGLRGGV